jgi:hypothetical protein
VLIDSGGQPGVSSRPPDAADAIRHGDNPTTTGHLEAVPAAAASTAATASRNGEPAAAAGTGSTPTPTSNTVKNPRTASAREANARSHPRTVAPGRPSRAAIGRHPDPAAFAASAAPITSTASARRTSTDTGSNTCVTPHDAHRPRRGRTPSTPARPRTVRNLAQPHRDNAAPHGQWIRPAANAVSTAEDESLTVIISASERSHGPPDIAGKTKDGRAVTMTVHGHGDAADHR